MMAWWLIQKMAMMKKDEEPQTKEIGDTLVYAKYDLSGLPELQVNW